MSPLPLQLWPERRKKLSAGAGFFLGLTLLAGGSASAAVDVSKLPPAADQKIIFATDIAPILQNSCLRCHGSERPKSRFRLDKREDALKGGENGVAILPGHSAESPLIHYVARLVEDMEMPPSGKGEPLTTNEIALLRAWIDQGADWSGATNTVAQASATPGLRFVTVSGNQQKFRDHFGLQNGFSPGLEEFLLQDRLGKGVLRLEGRTYPRDGEYQVGLRYDQPETGFIRSGFTQTRYFYGDSGGYYPFTQPNFALNRDLHMDSGKAWVDFGLTLPDWPKIILGYEYQFREGTESTLQWGGVKTTSAPLLPVAPFQRNIYPAFKDIHEHTHTLKLDLDHELWGVDFADALRISFYDLGTQRENVLSFTQGQTEPTKSVQLKETHNQFTAANAFKLDKEIRDWLYVSGGYLYSHADADASFQQNTLHVTGLPVGGDYWKSQALLLSQDSHLFNANLRLGPWENLTASAGVQSEWSEQRGLGRVSLDTGNPATFLIVQPARLDANLSRHDLKEMAALNFTGLPATTLFAEGRLEQEQISQIEDQLGGPHEFIRDTAAEMDGWDAKAGFYSSPWTKISFGSHFRHRERNTDYNNNLDIDASGTPHDGYPAFIRARSMDSDEAEFKVTLRPVRWLKTTLSYQWLETDYDTTTDPVPGLTPGGFINAANLHANVYGLNFVLTPFRRWYFSGNFNYYDARTQAAANGQPSVSPYRGGIFSALGSLSYVLNEATDLNLNYSYSRADYGQNNFAGGLPMGLDYDLHSLQAGVTRRFARQRLSTSLQYGFYRYAEPSGGGFNDYTAHAVFGMLTWRWK